MEIIKYGERILDLLRKLSITVYDVEAHQACSNVFKFLFYIDNTSYKKYYVRQSLPKVLENLFLESLQKGLDIHFYTKGIHPETKNPRYLFSPDDHRIYGNSLITLTEDPCDFHKSMNKTPNPEDFLGSWDDV